MSVSKLLPPDQPFVKHEVIWMTSLLVFPGERVVVYVNNLGVLRGGFQFFDYSTCDARIKIDDFGDSALQSADIEDVIHEAIYDQLLEKGWILDRRYYRLQPPEGGDLMSFAQAEKWYRQASASEH